MQDLIIYGSGSVGKVIEQIVFDINQENPRWNLLGFLDDNPEKHGQTVAGKPVMGGIEELRKYPDIAVIIGLATPRSKQQIVDNLTAIGITDFPSLIHPLAWVSRRVEIGPGCILYPGVYVDVDVRLGSHVILNKHCTVGHDTRIGSFATASPGVNLGGHNTIGEGVEFGINSATIQELTIGEWSVIGAGAIVIREVPSRRVFAGVPARDLNRSKEPDGKRTLVIVGAGGLGREVAWTALEMNRILSRHEQWQLAGFADDAVYLHGSRVSGMPVLGTPEQVEIETPVWFHCAIGDNLKRRQMAERCLRLNWKPATLIHPNVLTAGNGMFGAGTYIGAGSIVNPDVTIGSFALINQRVAIGHDAVIEDWSQLNPGAQINGSCRVGQGAVVGSNTSLHPNTKVGAFAVVGSNSQVLRNVAPGTTVNGVPAKRIK